MRHFFEIYRPILGNGASELSSAAREIAGRMGLGEESTFLHFGGAHPAKASIYRVGGEAATRLYMRYDELEELAQLASNAQTVRPDLILWGYDLPDKQMRRNQMRPEMRPKIQLAERVDKVSKLGASIDSDLAKLIEEISDTNSLTGHGFARGAFGSIRSHTVSQIPLIGINGRNIVPERGAIIGLRREMAEFIPEIELGPVEIGISPLSADSVNSYGYLA